MQLMFLRRDYRFVLENFGDFRKNEKGVVFLQLKISKGCIKFILICSLD